METVLIIEDDPTMLIGLKDNFEFQGLQGAHRRRWRERVEGRAELQARPDPPRHHAAQDQRLRDLPADSRGKLARRSSC